MCCEMQRKFKILSVSGWVATLCVVLTSTLLAKRGNVREIETLDFPKLYEYDDFNKCRRENPKYQYCVVEAVIQPDASSEMWQNINAVSSSSLNFPRDHLERGICLHDCIKRRNGTIRMSDLTVNEDSQRVDYLSFCAIESLKRTHNLQASVSIKNCVTYENLDQTLKLSEMAFIALVTIVTVLVGFATISKHSGSRSSQGSSPLIEAFSLKRNMARLLNTSDQPPNLPFLEGIRIILTVLVLVAHANTAVLRTPITNPEDIELQNNSFFFPLINSLNTHVISMFFTVAGMVQADSFLSAIDKSVGRIQVGFVLKKIFRRLANLVPAYAFVIFYQATPFPRTKLTPVGYKHQDYCDRHWWTNLLFINNYVHADEPCMKFGWYLGVDFQLFLFSAAIMMIIWRFPRIKMLCTYLMIASSLALPAIEIYKEKLDATSTFNMKHALTDYLSYEGYLKNYAPTTVNAGYYFVGMISGFTYHHINKHENLHFKAFSYSSKLITSITPIFLAINGILLVLSSLPKPSIILALYGSALKAIWSVANGSLLLYLALRSKTRIIALLAHPKLRVPKLRVQLSVVYTFYSHLSVPITNNAPHAIYVTSVISFVSCASGLLLYLAVQAPCTILLNRLIDRMFAKREIARRKTDKIL